MPIRRAAATPTQEKAPSSAAEKEADASEESPSAEDEQAASSAATAEGEEETSGDTRSDTNEEKAEEDASEEKDKKEDEKEMKCQDCAAGQCATHCYVLLLRMKDGYKYEKSKTKKVKRTIPAWASITASKKIPVTNYAGTQNKVDNILIEAVASSNDRSGISFQSVMKFMLKKYPSLELNKKKFLIKKAMKKHLEKGTIKQLKGKGLSGTFAIGKQPPQSKKSVQKQEPLGDALPLIITRLCEPKEASYGLIKKYLEKHFPSLNIENRPDVLKTALVKAVEKGHLEQVTGKGACGTFQLKRASKEASLKGTILEDAITVAITAMNEPKTCSATSLRKYLIDSNKDVRENQLVANLRRTLTKCKVLGWIKQITGHGLTGTYGLSFPFYPSPIILYPDKFNELSKKPAKRRQTVETSDEEEEEESEEEESEDEAPPKRKTKVLSRKDRRPPPAKTSRRASQSRARGRAHPPAKKTPPKKAAVPAKKSGGRQTTSKKESAETPVKKGAASRKPKKPAVKKLNKRGARRPVSRESTPEESDDEVETTKGGSRRSKPESSPAKPVEKETTRSGSKRSKPQESLPEEPAVKKPATKGGSKKSKAEEPSPEEPPVKKQATKGGSKRSEPESKPVVKKEMKTKKQSTRKSKRGKN
nr:heterochromatin protein 1-binding protein 3 isoform X1 [Nothobranchius furzeri]XP_015813874.2 heterochromatin protein 1-binding protein 3 isoform X1 [Nothobranchius furzeri]